MLFAISPLATNHDLPNQPGKRRLLDPRSHQIHHPNNIINVLNLRRQNCPLFWVAAAANYSRNFIHSSQKTPKIPSSNLDFNNLVAAADDHRLHTQPKLQNGENILLVAHGNSIRALIKYLDQVPEAEMANVEMPFGQLLVYTFEPGQSLPIKKEVLSVEIEAVNA